MATRRWAALNKPNAVAMAGLAAWMTVWFLPPYVQTGAQHPTGEWLLFKLGAFGLTGDHRFASSPLHLYVDNPALQIGPPAFALTAAAIVLINPAFATLSMAVFMLSVGFVLVVGALGRAWERAAASSQKLGIAVLAMAVTAPWARDVGEWRHLDDVLAIGAGAAAVWLVGREAPSWAGVCMGLACASKPWAVVLAPVLLALPRPSRARGALLAIVVASSCWAPFIIAAPDTVTALGSYHVLPDPGTLVSLLGFDGDASRWLRLLQLTAAAGAAAVVALRRPWYCVPLAGLAVKALFDPFYYSYYGLAPIMFALLLDRGRAATQRPTHSIAAMIAFYGTWWLLPPTPSGLARTAWSLGVLAWIARHDRQPRIGSASADPRGAEAPTSAG